MDEIIQLILCVIVVHYLSCLYKQYTLASLFSSVKEASMTWKHIIIIPVVSSLVLVLIFFFPKIGKYFLYFSVFFTGFTCFYLIFTPLTEKLNSLPDNLKYFITCVLAVFVIVMYIMVHTTFTTNLVGIGVAIAIQSLLYVSKVYIPVVLLTVMFFYDIFWVFGSVLVPVFDGKSVMVETAKTATSLKLPLLLEFHSIFGDGHFMIGLGDIVLPGILINFTYCLDRFYKTKYFFCTLGGYIFGLLLTILMLWKFRVGQPALLYLVPSMFVGFFGHGFYTKTLKTAFSMNLSDNYTQLFQDSLSGNDPQSDQMHQEIVLHDPEEMVEQLDKREDEKKRAEDTKDNIYSIELD
ncbi:signal peptide peptidase, putative [Entamoeba invadens IP1]|uniref:Signal peptide peptidase, putative n=1 Tax=Entamoeba invadens IP1 TaxID=370355 RepID=L7FLZ6_ENTIV|nr:signal peptide peptidase, putative [Entamoeba invadens IP1]ELP84883.1 signal peptide peptidase, putative [Entamoeba invadens IP1]|eukprot:XP_004184229.1 signal peptide peptidase, putative [Entamoeba invadens IP1]